MHRFCLLLQLVLLSVTAAAADDRYGIFTVHDDWPDAIVLDGTITLTSGVDLRRALRAHPLIDTIVLESPGGDVEGALDVAYGVRGLRTMVGDGARCNGACAYIYFAGHDRLALGTVGVTQIAGTGGIGAARETLAALLAALEDFGVPMTVIVDMLRTPPNEIRTYQPAELVELGLSTAPVVEFPVPATRMGTAPVVEAPVTYTGALLLEAATDGATSAVPARGTSAWSIGPDDRGAPMLTVSADFPNVGLSAEILFRRNDDASLPAEAIIEVRFSVTDRFEGSSIAGLPGILAKDEELVQGAPLVGASARIVGNQFLFALTGSPDDAAANRDLLLSRTYFDFAIIYDTGRRAILTLKKNEDVQAMLEQVMARWSDLPGKGRKTGG